MRTMTKAKASRRKFIKQSVSSAAGLLAMSAVPTGTLLASANSAGPVPLKRRETMTNQTTPKLRFSVIGINHDHIHGQVGAMIRGGGEFVSFYAKEPDLAAAFAKRYPNVKQVQDQAAILEDKTIQLVVSAAIPVERAPIGIAVMKHGKDYMSDKPASLHSLNSRKSAASKKKQTASTRSCTASALKIRRLSEPAN